MIGDGWDSEPSVRPGDYEPGEPRKLRIAVVTGTRAEFGLLRPVMHAIQHHSSLELLVIAAGSHLILPALTFRDVKAHFQVADSVPMQVAGKTTRFDDAEATGRGVARFARSFEGLRPDWVVVLGDRIEAFAAAAAASIAGYPLAHIHGGDRAEGIADESMRHAITKLANLHFPATAQSAERIIRMGERKDLVHNVGSPAMDDLPSFGPLAEAEDEELGRPNAVLLMHPIGRTPEAEEASTAAAIEACRDLRLLALHPNHDPGRHGVLRAIAAAGVREVSHLARPKFVGLLRRVRERGGLMLGNSSAGLIEAAAIGLPVVDIGPRQAGRERAGNVIHTEHETVDAIAQAIIRARALNPDPADHPYGDGQTGRRIADILARTDLRDRAILRKRIVY